MKSIKLPLIYLSLFATPLAWAQDIFSIFDEQMSATIDISIRQLDYQKSDNFLEPQGSFSFERFKIISDKTNIQLHNESHFYDAQIYRRDRLIGFQGPAASFAYKLNEDDFGYINSFDWMNLEDVGFFMDRSRIQLSGKNLAMREPQYVLLANNIDLNCDRHPDYLLNNGDGFLAGCFNFGEALPKSGLGMGLDFKFFDEQGVNLVDLQGLIKKANLIQDKVTAELTSITANFSEKNLFNATELNVECLKSPNLMKMNPEKFVVPCLKDIEMKGDFISLDFLTEGDKMTVVAPDFKHHDLNLDLSFEELKFKTKDSEFNLSGAVLNCDTPAKHDLLEIETFMKGCLNSSQLLVKDEEIVFNYLIKENEGDKPFDLKLNADVQSLSFSEGKIDVNSNRLKIEVDSEIFIGLDDLIWSCEKEPGIDEFDAKAIFDRCKNGLDLDVGKFSIKDFVDLQKPILAEAEPEVVRNINGLLHLQVPKLKLVDREDLTVMKDLEIICKTEGKHDVFMPNEVIAACVNRGQIKVDKLFTDDSSLSPAQIMNPNMNLNRVRIVEKNPKIFDINIITQDGIVYFDLKTKVLGLKSNVKFSGPINWDMEKEIITIKVENSRLPMGIKSENIFMFFLKKMLVAEMVTYEKNNTIKISL